MFKTFKSFKALPETDVRQTKYKSESSERADEIDGDRYLE
jgi:hypothetical protein